MKSLLHEVKVESGSDEENKDRGTPPRTLTFITARRPRDQERRARPRLAPEREEVWNAQLSVEGRTLVLSPLDVLKQQQQQETIWRLAQFQFMSKRLP